MENGTSTASQALLNIQLSIFILDLNVSNTNAERKSALTRKNGQATLLGGVGLGWRENVLRGN